MIPALPVFLCPWKGGISQEARDGGANMPMEGGMQQRGRDGGVAMHGNVFKSLLPLGEG